MADDVRPIALRGVSHEELYRLNFNLNDPFYTSLRYRRLISEMLNIMTSLLTSYWGLDPLTVRTA